MDNRAQTIFIGVFVLGALALSVAAIIVFGGGRYFAEKRPFVMFFDETIKGLSVGAPVSFRGVKIGQVTGIRAYMNTDDMSLQIPVYVEIEPDRLRAVGQDEQDADARRSHLPELIAHGLRARLEVESLVTGILFISVDFYPDKPARLVGAEPDFAEVPTIPSSFKELSQTVQDLPLKELVNSAQNVVAGLERLVNSRAVQGNIEALQQTQAVVQQFVRSLEQDVPPLLDSVRETSDTLRAATATASTTLTRLQRSFDADSRLQQELSLTLAELTAAARAMRAVAETLQRQPEALIYGKDLPGGASMKRKLYVRLAVVALCVACSGTPHSRYYVLSAPVAGDQQPGCVSGAMPVVAIGPVSLPAYLNRSEIVMRDSDNQVELARFDLWAEPLDAGLTRVVAADASRRLRGAAIVHDWQRVRRYDHQVLISLERFDVARDGTATLVARWQVIDHHERTLLVDREARYTTGVAHADDVAANVAAMSLLAQRLADAVAADIRQLLQ